MTSEAPTLSEKKGGEKRGRELLLYFGGLMVVWVSSGVFTILEFVRGFA